MGDVYGMTMKWFFSNSSRVNGIIIGNCAVSCLQISQFSSFIAEELWDPEGIFFSKHCTENKSPGRSRSYMESSSLIYSTSITKGIF